MANLQITKRFYFGMCHYCDGTGLRYDIGFGDRLTPVDFCSYCGGKKVLAGGK